MKKFLTIATAAFLASSTMAFAAGVDCGGYGKNYGAIQKYIKDYAETNLPDENINSYAQYIKWYNETFDEDINVGEQTQAVLGGICGVGSEAP